MADDEQQQSGIRSTPYMSPMHMYGSAIITLTDPDNELYKLELTLRSAREDKDGNLQTYGEPLMNDYGISSILGVIQSIVSRDAVLSNFNKAELPNLMLFLNDTLSRDLMINRKDYGIKSVSARDKIYYSAMTMAFITLKRGYEEGDKRFWKGSVQEIHSKVEAPNQRKGLLSSLNPFK